MTTNGNGNGWKTAALSALGALLLLGLTLREQWLSVAFRDAVQHIADLERRVTQLEAARK